MNSLSTGVAAPTARLGAASSMARHPAIQLLPKHRKRRTARRGTGIIHPTDVRKLLWTAVAATAACPMATLI